jgi:glycosyltransferase involved in cell wall biosynthesis
MNSLTIVIPAYNEADSLPATLPLVLAFCKEHRAKLIVVNDGSKDATREVLARFSDEPRLQVIHHKLNRGYGGALKSGLSAVDTDLAVTFDADGQHKLEDIDRMLDILQKEDADMVIGCRVQNGKKNWYRETGKWLIRRIAALMMPMPLQDLNSGFKLYRTDLVQQYLQLCPNSMAFSDVIALIFLDQRNKVIELPIEVLPRLSGDSSINTKTAFETVLEILNLVMLLNPLRIFLTVSIICFVVGFGWGIPFVVMGRGISVGAMLAILTGVITFTLGLIAEQLSGIRKGKINIKRKK